MRMVDLIEKKKKGQELSKEEISWMIRSYLKGDVKDYQMSAMLMAIWFRGMTEEETLQLTLEMEYSGDVVDLSELPGVKVDKHSTGGVGDKTTLIIGPIVAACGGVVAKMSGRGLGHTGGTLDKLESIPGFRVDLSRERFFDTVKKVGVSVIGQTGNLVPADKEFYAMRDVTATVDSIPLIASSVMSKKLAAGSDAILLDVKCGSGAFMKTPEDAGKLARQMVKIGNMAGRRTEAVITCMDIPLGHNIGNALEVKEAISVLMGEGPEDLRNECITLASRMLVISDVATEEEAEEKVRKAIKDGSALRKLAEMTAAQGGDPDVIYHPNKLAIAPICHPILAGRDGFIGAMDTEGIGIASMLLGAGRETKEDRLDPGAGIVLYRKYGDEVVKGEVIAELYTSDEMRLPAAEAKLLRSMSIEPERPTPIPLIFEHVKG